MKKEDYIRRYGEEAYEKQQQQRDEWETQHPEQVKASQNEQCRKGGKYYEQHYKYSSTGLPHARNLIRQKHAKHYRIYKQIIAPESQIHHQWIPGTADYRGVALVEKDSHQYGIIDVIQILEGEITLLTEEEIRKRGSEIKC